MKIKIRKIKMSKPKIENQNNNKRNLNPDAELLLDADNDKRIQYIKIPIYIVYSEAEIIYQEIMDLFDQGERERMEGLLLISPTNNGKTSLIKRFINDNSPKVDGNLVYVETPEKTTLKELFLEILHVLGYPAHTSVSIEDLRRKILVALRRKNVKMLFVDEIHNLLDSRRDHKKDILNGLRSLNNNVQIPIVLIGIEKAKNILTEDEQIADSYSSIELPLWKCDTKPSTRQFKDLLATFETYLPLKKQSNLHYANISKKMHELSSGHLGRVATIIRKASIKAIRTGKEQITVSLLNSMRFRWKPLVTSK